MSHKVIQPEGWAAAKGYANGILTKDGTLYVGWQIGWTAEQRFHSPVSYTHLTLPTILLV